MNGQIRGCPIQKTHVIVQPRNFDPIQKTHVKGGAAQLWGGAELIERVQFSIVPGARLFSLGKRILTRHPCESSLVFYRRKSPKINKRVHFLTKSAKKRPPPSPPYILCGPGPGRAPPGLPPGGAPVCGCAGSPSTGYGQTGLNRPVSSSNAQPARFGHIPWTGTPPTPRRQIWK